MSFSDIISAAAGPAVSFAHSNPLIAVAALAVLAFLIYRRPYFFILMLLIGLLVVGALYIIMSASGPGVSVKERMVRPERAPQNIVRSSGLFLCLPFPGGCYKLSITSFSFARIYPATARSAGFATACMDAIGKESPGSPPRKGLPEVQSLPLR